MLPFNGFLLQASEDKDSSSLDWEAPMGGALGFVLGFGLFGRKLGGFPWGFWMFLANFLDWSNSLLVN